MRNEIPKNVSESVRIRNPHLYPALDQVAARQSEPVALRPLEQGVQKRKKGKGGVEIVVSLVTFRSRELDDDGNVAALKPLRDAIAEALGLDDGDKRIRFIYGQCETIGEFGVTVKIERLNYAPN